MTLRWRLRILLISIEAEYLAWKAVWQIFMREMWRR